MRLAFSLLACSLCMSAQEPNPGERPASSDASLAAPSSAATLASASSAAQSPEASAAQDASSVREPEAGDAPKNADPADDPSDILTQLTTPASFERPVSWLKLAGNLEQDQRAIWLAPRKLKDKRYWIPTAAVLATTATLVALDPKTGHFFRNASMFNTFNGIFTSRNTQLGLWISPFALYAAGWVANDSKMTSTALLAGEAVIDSEILTTILKDIDRRQRPMDLAANGNFSDSWFDGKGGIQGRGSFPSGHTIAAFSIATVVARRYGNHKWVPYVAYGTAALIGFSRLTLSSHWGSDVFVGGALGYSISRFTVLQQ